MTNEVIQNILTRCSVRAYDDRPVEREKIDTLLQCAVHAPSAMNRQTWHFSAVLNREKIAKLAVAVGKALGNEKYDMYKPAALIIPSNELIGDTGITSWDNACALENIFLAAHSMGLGTVWINQLSDTCDVPEVRAVLTEFGVPENHKVFGIAAIGYAAAETPVKETEIPRYVCGVKKSKVKAPARFDPAGAF
ncbi:nitroreductase family protein [Hominenteromicrobium sp.]|uniref:nitroreductase family protein n=1 Tax=Hominenteromicrobium sp. TaxID=3073581 RepID=UPI003992CDA1